MNDNLDPDHVDADCPTATAFWARYFQVPVEDIRIAAATVGSDPVKVAEFLEKPYRPLNAVRQPERSASLRKRRTPE